MSKKRVTAQDRKLVVERAGERCEYCRSSMLYTTDTFDVEHIRPRYRSGETTLDNLALSCAGCNSYKATKVVARDPMTGQTVPLFHPRQDKWSVHFSWSEDFTLLIGLTSTGWATIQALKMNRIGLINLRYALTLAGKHPPLEPQDSETTEHEDKQHG